MQMGLDLGWMALAVETDEAPNPAAISVLRADAVVHAAVTVADSIEQWNRRNHPHQPAYAPKHKPLL